jgi:RHH-type rel operon transcriptional repressor/antitoxin RelB
MPTSIELDPLTEQRLERLVRQTGRGKTDYLREWIANGLEDIEDAEAAAATMERVSSGHERTYSSEQVRKELGLDD